jgi:hypothetical protein
MNARLQKYVPLFLVSALAVTACGDDSTSPTAPGQIQAATFTAEPDTIAPEFFPSGFCHRFTPFGARFTVVARPSHDVFIRDMRFHFLDRFGRRSVPTVIPLQTISAAVPPMSGPITIPTSPTIPFPGATTPFPASPAIPIPGVSGFDLLIIGGSSRTLPFFLQFGCGIPADGTVFVDFDLSDRRGRSTTSQLHVRLRG